LRLQVKGWATGSGGAEFRPAMSMSGNSYWQRPNWVTQWKMPPDDFAKFTAMRSGDARFDGKFFIAVKTTKIYCRSICPARPRRKNVVFFASALAAEKEGYRPCLRCRPESAPQSAAWMGTSAVVGRALQKLWTDATFSDEEFANRLGLGARHLRRLFVDELGKTPKQIFDIHRLNFARKLVVETRLPISQVADASGLSVRRFNDAFMQRFRRSPVALRKTSNRKHVDTSSVVTLQLSYRPPFDWQAMLQWLRLHQMEGVECIDDNSYHRMFVVDGARAAFRVTHAQQQHQLVVEVSIEDAGKLLWLTHRVRQMFDLDADPLLIGDHLSSHSRLLAKLVKRHVGLRVPHGISVFEVGVCAILGQLVSTAHAKRLVARLVACYGQKTKSPIDGSEFALFPTANVLAKANFETLATSESRKKCLRDFSAAVMNGHIAEDPLQNPDDFKRSLRSIVGIGAWTAEYVALRSLYDADSFPSTDLILARVQRVFPTLDVATLRPWRSYAAIYLWREFAMTPSGAAALQRGLSRRTQSSKRA
jgi:AraC family transcriptional regulator, regulatory protein of adaptative response / DNA-3-methyladenine glycosylase II